MIFVFGSNEAGRHGAGAALHAMKHHGAKYGKGFGHQGNSFAIPTKDYDLRVLSLESIKAGISSFIVYAFDHPELEFQVTQIGCGLARLSPADIAPLFQRAPANCLFDSAWAKYFRGEKRYWGHVNPSLT